MELIKGIHRIMLCSTQLELFGTMKLLLMLLIEMMFIIEVTKKPQVIQLIRSNAKNSSIFTFYTYTSIIKFFKNLNFIVYSNVIKNIFIKSYVIKIIPNHISKINQSKNHIYIYESF